MNPECAAVEREAELSRFQHLAIGVTQDREQYLVLQLRTGRGLPGDVEVGGVPRGRAVLEHIVPPGVIVGRYPHVVGDDVEDLPQAVFVKSRHPGLVILRGTDFRIETGVIGDVVAMSASGPGFQIRRRVNVRDAEIVQVRDDRPGVTEGEAGMELETVGGLREPSPLLSKDLGFLKEFVDRVHELSW